MLRAAVFDPDLLLKGKQLDDLTKAHLLSQTPTSWNLKSKDDDFELVDFDHQEKQKMFASIHTDNQINQKYKQTVLVRPSAGGIDAPIEMSASKNNQEP